jgi:hypothetical protein
MRIDPSSGFSAINPSTTTGVTTAGGSKPGVKAEPPGGEDSTFTPTPDLARLLAAVKSLPDVRADVVAEVSDRLATGDLLSSQAASDTAQAMLAGPAPND